jgi:hypothetical protein
VQLPLESLKDERTFELFHGNVRRSSGVRIGAMLSANRPDEK